MPLATRTDLMNVTLESNVDFYQGESHKHVKIGNKDFIAKQRDPQSWFLIGQEGVIGMLLKSSNGGYHIVVLKKRKLSM